MASRLAMPEERYIVTKKIIFTGFLKLLIEELGLKFKLVL